MIDAPRVADCNRPAWEAFRRLSAGREREPLKTRDIMAYGRDIGLAGCADMSEFMDLMQHMDATYLAWARSGK